MPNRPSAWLAQWGPVLPLLVAESTIWLGFGALLPVLALYFTDRGVDLPTLGIVVAAWPAARLIGEPACGWLADRVSRRRLMIAGLLLTSLFTVLQLFVAGALPFIVLRALQGLSAAMYDPAARAYLADANPPDRQGEAFGLYGAAQTAGFMLGPAVGGIAAGITGAAEVVFWVAGLALLVSAGLVLLRVPELAHLRAARVSAGQAVGADDGDGRRPQRILNRLLVAAICFAVGSYFAGGVYEVIWSVYMDRALGADIGLIGLTFVTFGVPSLVLGPFMGRFIDRHGGFLALAAGMALIAGCGVAYPAIREIWWMVALGLVEGTGFAMATPAVFLLVARSAPAGRSSSAQGVIGGAGTVGTIVASVAAGRLADIDLALPFYAVGVAGLAALAVGLLLGGRRLYDAMQPRAAIAAPAAVAAPAPEGGA